MFTGIRQGRGHDLAMVDQRDRIIGQAANGDSALVVIRLGEFSSPGGGFSCVRR